MRSKKEIQGKLKSVKIYYDSLHPESRKEIILGRIQAYEWVLDDKPSGEGE